MGERLDRALALAERFVAAVERIAEAADRDVKPANMPKPPRPTRALTDEQVREVSRRKLTRAGALPR